MLQYTLHRDPAAEEALLAHAQAIVAATGRDLVDVLCEIAAEGKPQASGVVDGISADPDRAAMHAAAQAIVKATGVDYVRAAVLAECGMREEARRAAIAAALRANPSQPARPPAPIAATPALAPAVLNLAVTRRAPRPGDHVTVYMRGGRVELQRGTR